MIQYRETLYFFAAKGELPPLNGNEEGTGGGRVLTRYVIISKHLTFSQFFYIFLSIESKFIMATSYRIYTFFSKDIHIPEEFHEEPFFIKSLCAQNKREIIETLGHENHFIHNINPTFHDS